MDNHVKTMFSWETPSLGSMVVLSITCIVMYVLIFKIIKNLPSKLQEYVDKVIYKCFVRCDTDLCKRVTDMRDDNYYVSDKPVDNPRDCIFTMWELLHGIFHVFLGWFFPLHISLCISVLFEILEHYVFNCGSGVDIFWNGAGSLIGRALRLKYGS